MTVFRKVDFSRYFQAEKLIHYVRNSHFLDKVLEMETGRWLIRSGYFYIFPQ